MSGEVIGIDGLTDQQREGARLAAAGWRGVDIAEHLDMAPETVSRWRKKPEYVGAIEAILSEARSEVLRCTPNSPHRCKIRGMEALANRPASTVPFPARPTGKWNGTPRKTPEGQPKREKDRISLHDTWQRALSRNMQRNDENVAIGTAT